MDSESMDEMDTNRRKHYAISGGIVLIDRLFSRLLVDFSFVIRNGFRHNQMYAFFRSWSRFSTCSVSFCMIDFCARWFIVGLFVWL